MIETKEKTAMAYGIVILMLCSAIFAVFFANIFPCKAEFKAGSNVSDAAIDYTDWLPIKDNNTLNQWLKGEYGKNAYLCNNINDFVSDSSLIYEIDYILDGRGYEIRNITNITPDNEINYYLDGKKYCYGNFAGVIKVGGAVKNLKYSYIGNTEIESDKIGETYYSPFVGVNYGTVENVYMNYCGKSDFNLLSNTKSKIGQELYIGGLIGLNKGDYCNISVVYDKNSVIKGTAFSNYTSIMLFSEALTIIGGIIGKSDKGGDNLSLINNGGSINAEAKGRDNNAAQRCKHTCYIGGIIGSFVPSDNMDLINGVIVKGDFNGFMTAYQGVTLKKSYLILGNDSKELVLNAILSKAVSYLNNSNIREIKVDYDVDVSFDSADKSALVFQSDNIFWDYVDTKGNLIFVGNKYSNRLLIEKPDTEYDFFCSYGKTGNISLGFESRSKVYDGIAIKYDLNSDTEIVYDKLLLNHNIVNVGQYTLELSDIVYIDYDNKIVIPKENVEIKSETTEIIPKELNIMWSDNCRFKSNGEYQAIKPMIQGIITEDSDKNIYSIIGYAKYAADYPYMTTIVLNSYNYILNGQINHEFYIDFLDVYCSADIYGYVGTDKYRVDYNEIINLDISPKYGYILGELWVNDIKMDSTTKALIIQCDTFIKAEFKPRELNVGKFSENGKIQLISGIESFNNEVVYRALADENYMFLNWTNEMGVIISDSSYLKLVLVGDTKLFANFVAYDNNFHSIKFLDNNGRIYKNFIIESGTVLDIGQISHPQLKGYKFLNWKDKDDNDTDVTIVVDRDIIFYPVFITDPEAVKLNIEVINGTTIWEENAAQYSYNSVVTVKPNTESNFSYWINLNGDIISYKPEFKFAIFKNEVLTAVYDQDVKENTQINLTTIELSDNKISFIANYVTVSDTEVIEAGILFTENKSISDNFYLDDKDILYAKANKISPLNQFILTSPIKDYKTLYARAYIIYRIDSNIEIRYSAIKSISI